MKFHARFNEPSGERNREFELLSDSGSTRVAIDGVEMEFETRILSTGAYSMIGPGGRQVEVTVHPAKDGSVRVHVGSELFEFEFRDELTARALSAAGRGPGRKRGDLKASMPGRVLRVLVASGALVAEGEPILVLEAMKMENEVRSPREGTIRSIEVVAGQAVASGDVLARFEPES